MKLLLIFLITISVSFGTTINSSILKIHATIVPKLYLMDYSYREKTKNDMITIALIYTKIDYKNALLLKNKIDYKYSKGLKSYKVRTVVIPYEKVDSCNANIYYTFPSKFENIKKVIRQADENEALTFAYLENDLKYGIMISLNIGKKVKPVLNLDAIRLYNISFRPILLDISSIYGSNINKKENIL